MCMMVHMAYHGQLREQRVRYGGCYHFHYTLLLVVLIYMQSNTAPYFRSALGYLERDDADGVRDARALQHVW